MRSTYSINLISPGFKEIFKKCKNNTFSKTRFSYTPMDYQGLGNKIIKACSGEKPNMNAFTALSW